MYEMKELTNHLVILFPKDKGNYLLQGRGEIRFFVAVKVVKECVISSFSSAFFNQPKLE